MQVIVTARHCELSDQMRHNIERQFQRLSRFEPRATRAEVTVTGTKKGFETEALVSIERSARVHARAEGSEVRSAVDRLSEKLRVQLRRNHERRRDHRAPPMDEIAAAPDLGEDDEPWNEP